MTRESVWREEAGHPKPIYIRWLMSRWCNYNCHYCPTIHQKRKVPFITFRNAVRDPSLLKDFLAYRGHNSSHAFDNYPAEIWLDRFAKLSEHKLLITITGGEPFLDRKNAIVLLRGLTEMEHIQLISVDTNGFWNPDHFRGINWDKIRLKMSFHSVMVDLNNFEISLKEKLDAGVKISLINYVLHPNYIDDFEMVRERLGRIGCFTNAVIYFGEDEVPDKYLKLYERYLPQIDVKLHTMTQSPKGKACNFPVFAYRMDPLGRISVGCHPKRTSNFVNQALPTRFTTPTPCPYNRCVCNEMYAFSTLVSRAHTFDLTDEYITACNRHTG